MTVFHVLVTPADDYVTKREPFRRAHLERLQELRAAGRCVFGGPAPDGKGVDLGYRLERAEDLKGVVEGDPYWGGEVWKSYASRPFARFVAPAALVPVVTDGSRRTFIVEGPAADAGRAEKALGALRDIGRVHLGGVFETGASWALTSAADEKSATAWLAETGAWQPGSLTARPLLYVL